VSETVLPRSYSVQDNQIVVRLLISSKDTRYHLGGGTTHGQEGVGETCTSTTSTTSSTILPR
jgi:hypothetical protein